MRNSMHYSLFGIVLLLITSCAANNTELKNELTECKAERESLREQRDQYEESARSAAEEYQRMQRQYLEKWSELNARIDELEEFERRYKRVASAYDNLELQYSELEEWADTMMERFGPGIYAGTQYDRPVFIKRPDTATVSGIVEELNLSFRGAELPQLILLRIDGATIDLSVDDEYQLVSRMGSFGARIYILSVVYSLTSLDEVDCVRFDIMEGDHAGPGSYCRGD